MGVWREIEVPTNQKKALLHLSYFFENLIKKTDLVYVGRIHVDDSVCDGVDITHQNVIATLGVSSFTVERKDN